MQRPVNLPPTYEKLMQRHNSLINEYQAVKRKLESKTDALLIISRDLAESRAERDQFKLMADQLRDRCQNLKKQLQTDRTDKSPSPVYQCPINAAGIISQLEVDDLRQRLADAEGDVKLLREKIIKHRLGTSEQQQSQRKTLSVHERDELIEQLEKSRVENGQLEQDMKQLLDFKEELETERDTYKNKYQRLNSELNYIMRGDEKHVVDIDAMIMENRFLTQRVKQLQEENSVVSSSLKKYKHLIEKRKPTGILKTTTDHLLGGVLISQRQVKQLLASPASSPAAAPQMVQELKNLASTLLETINDKNLALSHQRKSNKLLASRITDLEKKLHDVEMSVDTNRLQERFEGWSELRGECAHIRSLIPSVSADNSIADDSSTLEGQLSDLDITSSHSDDLNESCNGDGDAAQPADTPSDTLVNVHLSSGSTDSSQCGAQSSQRVLSTDVSVQEPCISESSPSDFNSNIVS